MYEKEESFSSPHAHEEITLGRGVRVAAGMLLLTNLEGSCSWAKDFCQWQAGVSELQLSPSSQGTLLTGRNGG